MTGMKKSRIYVGFRVFLASASILILKSDSFLVFSDIQKEGVSQNIDITKPIRSKVRKLNMETHKTKRSILGNRSTP